MLLAWLFLNYVSGIPEAAYEEGVQAEKERTKSKFIGPKEGETAGVWMYSNLSPTEFVVSPSTEKIVFDGPIIYKTHVRYSGFFSEQYGFPGEYISSEMPNYLDFIAIDIKSAGKFQACSIKILVDKDGPFYHPPMEVYRPFAGTSLNMMRAAQPRRVQGFTERQYQSDFRNTFNSYDSSKNLRDAILGSYGLFGLQMEADATAEGTMYSPAVSVTKHNLFKEWVYVEMSTPCTTLTKNIFERPNVYLSSRQSGEKPSIFTFNKLVNFRLPNDLVNAVRQDFKKLDF